jgi:hypothetical protein
MPDFGLTLEQQTERPDLVFTPVASFAGAVIKDENYTIYRVTMR